ncbi:MAG: hypothetical protein JWO32_1316, partial [Bacteroidetes bacterium]|nr:hypothetical protein [Bacteroidota bacterium]
MKTEIKCPHCGKLIPITESVTNEIKQEIELKFSKERNQLNKLREDFEKEKEAINNLINARVNSMVKQKEDVIRKRLESEKAL